MVKAERHRRQIILSTRTTLSEYCQDLNCAEWLRRPRTPASALLVTSATSGALWAVCERSDTSDCPGWLYCTLRAASSEQSRGYAPCCPNGAKGAAQGQSRAPDMVCLVPHFEDISCSGSPRDIHDRDHFLLGRNELGSTQFSGGYRTRAFDEAQASPVSYLIRHWLS